MAFTMVSNGPTKELSAAQILIKKHQEARKQFVEDGLSKSTMIPTAITREPMAVNSKISDLNNISAKTAAKQDAESVPENQTQILDTKCDKLFPGLGAGAPKTISAPVWGANKSDTDGPHPSDDNKLSSGTSLPGGMNPMPPPIRSLPQSLAGQIQPPILTLQSKDVLSRHQLKKPIPDILRDINRKLRVNLVLMTGEGGILEFRETSNQKEGFKQLAIKELGTLIGAKKSVKIEIPCSTKAYIIGRQGSNIKAIQESTGARIQIPRTEDTSAIDDENNDMIDVTIEGNPVAIQLAQKEIGKIVAERDANIHIRLRTIPAEFYPFISGPHDATVHKLEQAHNVQIQIPVYYIWTSQPPPLKPSAGQLPVFTPNPSMEELITITGDRRNVQNAQAVIEQMAQKLHQELSVAQFMVNNSQHQFITSEQGVSPRDFFAKTGCGIILPSDVNEDSVTVVGPLERIENAIDYAIDLASSMNQTIIDVSRLYRNAPGSARIHARNFTMYLRDRQEIEKICSRYQIFIATPMASEGAAPWEIFYRSENNKVATKAQSEIGSIVLAHPPSRMANICVDNFFYDYLRRDVSPKVRKDYGVYIVLPKGNTSDENIVLVYEGEPEDGSEYQISRETPTAEQIQLFEKSILESQQYILGIVSKQARITEKSTNVPRIFHEKLRKYIQKEQKERAPDQIPVRVFVSGTRLTLRGPEPAVEALSSKVEGFVAQAIEDEKERDFTLSFKFPQKHANQLIGKGGANIRDLKEKFDVEINVHDGEVEIKGPRAKSEAAKSHISSLGRQWADEVTFILKIDPIFHRELIGAQGTQINRLQTRYKAQIYFPRSAKPSKGDQSNADTASDVGRRSSRREQEPDEVIVKGPKKGASEARDEILSLLQYLRDNSHTATVSVQAGQIPLLIGQRGTVMDEIRQITMAKIEVPNAKDIKDPSTKIEIQIKGTNSSVAQAKKLIEDKRNVLDNCVTKTIEVSKEHHGALIGTQGSILRDIALKAGASDNRRELARTIQFPKPDSKDNLIKVEGPLELVDNIIQEIKTIVHERESMMTDSVEVPIQQHRSLIGRNGETKRDLETTLKVTIDIPRQDSGLTEIKITGLPDNVERAKCRIHEIISKREGETVLIPQSIYHDVAENGQIFRKIRNDYNVTIDHGGQRIPPRPMPVSKGQSNGTSLPLITDDNAVTKDAYLFSTVDIKASTDSCKIPWTLRGTPENVAKAKQFISIAVELALKNTTYGFLILPDPRTFKFVIGNGGSKVQTIRKATGCKITVPRDHSRDEAIEIIGMADQVEHAKEMILLAVKEGISASSTRINKS